jgi:hypothetical protein
LIRLEAGDQVGDLAVVPSEEEKEEPKETPGAGPGKGEAVKTETGETPQESLFESGAPTVEKPKKETAGGKPAKGPAAKRKGDKKPEKKGKKK